MMRFWSGQFAKPWPDKGATLNFSVKIQFGTSATTQQAILFLENV